MSVKGNQYYPLMLQDHTASCSFIVFSFLHLNNISFILFKTHTKIILL